MSEQTKTTPESRDNGTGHREGHRSTDQRPRQAHQLDRIIGAQLKILREDRGLSQAALGDRCDISFQQIQKYEKGLNRISASRLFTIASALGVSVTTILHAAAEEAQMRPAHSGDHDRLCSRLSAVSRDLDTSMLQHIVAVAEGLATRA